MMYNIVSRDEAGIENEMWEFVQDGVIVASAGGKIGSIRDETIRVRNTEMLSPTSKEMEIGDAAWDQAMVAPKTASLAEGLPAQELKNPLRFHIPVSGSHR